MAISTDFIVKNGLFVTEGATITWDALINGVTVGTAGVADNTVLGASALSSNSAGVDNVAIGSAALSSSTTGGANVAVGHDALSTSTASNNNVAIGNSAGSLVTGSNNVIVGNFTGNQNGLDISSSNSNVVIADGEGNVRMYVNSLGNIGINNVDPQTELHITGEITASSLTLTDALNIDGNMSVTGDLTVTGAINGILYGGAFLELNADTSELVQPIEDSGIFVNRGAEQDAYFYWDETQDRWTTGDDPNSPGTVATLEATIDGGGY